MIYYKQLDNEIFLYEDKECEIEYKREPYIHLETLLSEFLGTYEGNIKEGDI